MKYKIGNIYSLQITHNSFSWNNGLFICLEIKDDLLYGCKLSEFGEPEKFSDGRYMSFCTGVNNKEIFPTKLIYDLEKDYKYE